MFSYYGSKSKIAHLYPQPRYDVIVEPFAGSARYSLLHFDREVFLYDASPLIVEIWRYLIAASERDIRSLPDVPSGVHIDVFTQLAPVEKALIGFNLCRGKAVPRKRGHGQNSWSQDRERIARDLHKIRHWRVEQCSYLSILENRTATWFIDPPYRYANTAGNGDRYARSTIHYETLRYWIHSRRGQVIACEGTGADYLPFERLTTVSANTNNSTVKQIDELIYTR